MDRDQKQRHLVLVYGGGTVEGPIQRLGLADRVKPLSRRQLMFMAAAKLLLLSSVLYYLLVD